jgi:hypothetical protein
MDSLLNWQLYEINAKESSLNGVMLRGRIRKFGIENGLNVLAENTEDTENSVRFAALSLDDGEKIKKYVLSIIPDADIKLLEEDIQNPVLSKLKVNITERYTL